MAGPYRSNQHVKEERTARADMSRNIETVNTYLDGSRKNDHEQILSCLTDDIEWTVFGAFHLTGKEAYDKAIDSARFHRPT